MNYVQQNSVDAVREELKLEIRQRDVQPELVHPADILPIEEAERAKRVA